MTVRRQLKSQIADLLLGLGSGRAEVATKLQALGVRAVPKDPQGCAIACFLGVVVGGDSRVNSLSVQCSRVRVTTGGATFPLRRAVSVPLPAPVRQFVMAFDAGVYPSLITSESQDLPQASGKT